MPIKGKYTVWDAKQDDFNYHAPLDMTNVSLNYDNAFLDHIQNGHLPQIFIDNCRQAMMTGEPGFSFNFGDKENETLRNAPVVGSTQVLTSEGYKAVEDILHRKAVLWTGQQGAHDVEFKLTKKDSERVRVVLSNGLSLINI